jgi:hypothetical protein
MINPVSSAPVTSQPVLPQNAAPAKPQLAPPSAPQDAVQLSSKAQAQTSGDVDHDGDSR